MAQQDNDQLASRISVEEDPASLEQRLLKLRRESGEAIARGDYTLAKSLHDNIKALEQQAPADPTSLESAVASTAPESSFNDPKFLTVKPAARSRTPAQIEAEKQDALLRGVPGEGQPEAPITKTDLEPEPPPALPPALTETPTTTATSVSRTTRMSGTDGSSKRESMPSAPAIPDPPTYIPAEVSDLQAELRKAKDEYAKSKDNLAFREAIERIANGIGQMAAGLYGRNTGVDMSGVKFTNSDWDAKRRAESDDYKTLIGDVESRRRERITEANESNRVRSDNWKSSVSAAAEARRQTETERHNRETEAQNRERNAILESQSLAKAVEQMTKLTGKQSAAEQKALDEGVKRITDGLTKHLKDADDDVKQNYVKTVLTGPGFNLSPEAANAAVTQNGWLWGEDYDESKVYQSLQLIQSGRKLGSPPPGAVWAYDPKSGWGALDQSLIPTAIESKWLVLP